VQKPNSKTRPLSIYCYEDKLVQETLRRLLDADITGFFDNLDHDKNKAKTRENYCDMTKKTIK
jgi:retron-type reverse transcriptase